MLQHRLSQLLYKQQYTIKSRDKTNNAKTIYPTVIELHINMRLTAT